MTKFKIQESKVWKDSIGAGQRLWSNYLNVLSTYFSRMSRIDQEELISKFSWIITLGAASLAWYQIYPLFHPNIRLIALPITAIAAYWFGKNVVSKIMIERFAKYLNNQ